MTDSSIKVIKVNSDSELNQAQQIRYEVFVIGQNVPAEEEIDQFEDECNHFLALFNNQPCGAARWRITSSGVKLERFAVLEAFRKKGIGSALVKAVIEDILLRDQLGDTLCFIPKLTAGINQLNRKERHFKFGRVTLYDPYIKLMEDPGGGFNFDFVLEIFEKDTLNSP